jgi:hypothetical protein
MAVMQHE